jgi:hypothetical protein
MHYGKQATRCSSNVAHLSNNHPSFWYRSATFFGKKINNNEKKNQIVYLSMGSFGALEWQLQSQEQQLYGQGA